MTRDNDMRTISAEDRPVWRPEKYRANLPLGNDKDDEMEEKESCI